MLGINFLFILRKSVNFSVILFSNRKMNSTIVHGIVLLWCETPERCFNFTVNVEYILVYY